MTLSGLSSEYSTNCTNSQNFNYSCTPCLEKNSLQYSRHNFWQIYTWYTKVSGWCMPKIRKL